MSATQAAHCLREMNGLGFEACLCALAEVADSNTISGKPIVLNKQQCRYLARTCISSLKLADLPALPPPLVKEIHGTLQRIIAFFESCTEALWLRFLAHHLDPREAPLLHLKDFTICMVITLSLPKRHPTCNASPFVDGFISQISDCEDSIADRELEDCICVDRNDMFCLLGSMQGKQKKNEQHRGMKTSDAGPKSKDRKMKCFSFSFTKVKPIFHPSMVPKRTPSDHCLAAFLAKKCDEVVNLSARPDGVPDAFCINPRDLQVFKNRALGEEGISKVYEGTWLDQSVAVKEFEMQDQRFIRETSMLAGLSNPYIIKLIGWSQNEANGCYSLVMERMPQGLHDYMSGSSPSLQVKVDIMLQICRGMKYLHAMNVIHRDLKPSNVLVRPCEHKAGHLRIKVSDFGEAKHQPEMPFFSTDRLGTWYYRAPEVLQYDKEVNVVFKKYTLKADVFSFAILCYEIVAEMAPECYVNCTPREFYNRVRNNVRPGLPDSCPPLLSKCIKSCWHFEPSQRPSFAELSKALVYMKSALLVLDSPQVAGMSTALGYFVKEEVDEEAVL